MPLSTLNSSFKEMSSTRLILLISLYFTLVFNFRFVSQLMTSAAQNEPLNILFLFSIPLFLFLLISFLFGLITPVRLTKPMLAFLSVLSALLWYAQTFYGTVFDYGMVQNVFETDVAEAKTYSNFTGLVMIFLVLIIPLALIHWAKLTRLTWQKQLKGKLSYLLTTFILLMLVVYPQYSNFAAVGRNNHDVVNYLIPFKFFDSTYKYVRDTYIYPPMPFKELDTSPKLTSDEPKLTVLVVGETARSENFSVNGYERNTNEFTATQDVVSFGAVNSCGTATAISVPCMFSRLDKENYNKRGAQSQQNLLDIASLAGINVKWVDNNSSCKGVCTRVAYTKIEPKESNPLCDGDYCFDEALLEYLPEQMEVDAKSPNQQLLVLHMIGSHGPTYFRRYPKGFAKFLPDCQRSDIQNCTQQELLNTYDNTIYYTDYVLSKIIEKLSRLSTENEVETQMLYISDHGESLGENGVYLHGFPYALAPEQQTKVPMLYWHSGLKNSSKVTGCLQDLNRSDVQGNSTLSHDNLFDITLKVLSVDSALYKPERDLLSQCQLKYQRQTSQS